MKKKTKTTIQPAIPTDCPFCCWHMERVTPGRLTQHLVGYHLISDDHAIETLVNEWAERQLKT